MARSTRPGGRYVTPIDSNGVPVTTMTEPGKFTLAAGTYYYVLGASDAPIHSFHLTGYTAASTITTGSGPQDCNHGLNEVPDHDTTSGEWMAEDPTTAFVSVDGAGWATANGLITKDATAVGGALWHFSGDGTARHRIVLIVGVAGDFRGSAWGKE